MKNARLTAFVTDGLARDLEGIEEVVLIFCKGITQLTGETVQQRRGIPSTSISTFALVTLSSQTGTGRVPQRSFNRWLTVRQSVEAR